MTLNHQEKEPHIYLEGPYYSKGRGPGAGPAIETDSVACRARPLEAFQST